MSYADIERGGKYLRPSFNYEDHRGGTPTASTTAQVLESLRNLSEGFLRDQLDEARKQTAILLRIDRRLRQHMPLRSGRRKEN